MRHRHWSRGQSHARPQRLEVGFGSVEDVLGRLPAVVVLAAVGVSDDEAGLVLDDVVLVLAGLVARAAPLACCCLDFDIAEHGLDLGHGGLPPVWFYSFLTMSSRT